MSEPALNVAVDATTWINDRGFGRFTRELMTALVARPTGLRYTLLFDRLPAEPLPEGFEVLCASARRDLNESATGDGARSPADLLRLSALARDRRFDVIFFPAVYSYFPVFTRTPRVICYHDCTAERFPQYLFPKKINHRLWQLKTALALRQTTRAMTVTETSARDLVSILRIPRERIDVVTEAANPAYRVLDDEFAIAEARFRHGARPEDDLLVTLGGMNAHKNILRLLDAFPAILAARPHTRLAIVGDTSGKGFWDNVPALMARVDSNPLLAERVRFTGRLPDAEVVELLNGADALVFPSLWEGFGLPAVEAMQCGLPVLASRRGSLPEVVGDAGLLFDPEDVDDIARCVTGFLADAPLRERLRRAALARAQTFSWDRAAELAEASFRRAAATVA